MFFDSHGYGFIIDFVSHQCGIGGSQILKDLRMSLTHDYLLIESILFKSFQEFVIVLNDIMLALLKAFKF